MQLKGCEQGGSSNEWGSPTYEPLEAKKIMKRPTKPPPLQIKKKKSRTGERKKRRLRYPSTHVTMSGCIDSFLVHVQIRLESLDDFLREFDLRRASISVFFAY